MTQTLSTISYKMLDLSVVGCGKHFVVRSQQENLSDFVGKLIAEKGLNYREVARRSGGLISHSTVFDVINGRNKNVSARTLKGLAKGLGVTEDEIFAVVSGKSPEPMTRERFFAELQAMGVEDFHAAKGVVALTPADMEEILAVARSTVKTMVEEKMKAKKKGRK